MMTRRLIFALWLLAACSDLPGTDDPRTSSDYMENGSCSGDEWLCEDRMQSQCNSGCTASTGCKSAALDQCAALVDPTACDANTSCHWSAGACEPTVGIGCTANATVSDCTGDPSGWCAWGPTCTGYAHSCFDATSRDTCTANVGCTWTPG